MADTPTDAELEAVYDSTWAFGDDDTHIAGLRAVIARWGAQPAPAASPVPLTEERAEQALRKVLSVVQRYLPPDGPSAKDALSEIIAIVDPWPLGEANGITKGA